MTTCDHARRIGELFAADGVAHDLGVELELVDATGVRLRLDVDRQHIGWHGRCHGGVLFTLADIAMSYVGNRGPEVAFATHASVEFMAPVELGDTVIAEASEQATAGRAAVCDAVLTVEGTIVALFRGGTRQAHNPVNTMPRSE